LFVAYIIYPLKNAILLKLETVLLTSTKLYITDLIFVHKKLIHVEHIIHIKKCYY